MIDDPNFEPGLFRHEYLRPQPPHPGYKVSGVPKRYQDQVQLSAVLRPLAGPLRVDADIARSTAWTRHFWRRRAQELAQVGCPPFAHEIVAKSRLANALGCRVAFVMSYHDKKTKGDTPCGMPTICPFCWARMVRGLWLKLDAAFFPTKPTRKRRQRIVDVDHDHDHEPTKSSSVTRSVTDGEVGAKSPYDLVRRVVTFRLPDLVTGKAATGMAGMPYVAFPVSGIRAWLDDRVRGTATVDAGLYRQPECRALVESAGPGGGLLEMIHFRRVHDDDVARPWEIQVHQLILAVDGTKVPGAVSQAAVARGSHHIVFARPRRRFVVSAVARALHYPNWLIDPRLPVDRVVEYLDVRGSRRLVATYGRFRHQVPK